MLLKPFRLLSIWLGHVVPGKRCQTEKRWQRRTSSSDVDKLHPCLVEEGVHDRELCGAEGLTLHPGHRRRSPRMLAKKLVRMIWTPSAIAVAPGIARRIVRA